MKIRNFVLGTMAAMAGLGISSCSNDDIVIAYETEVRVNSSDVLSTFSEYNTGDLELLSSNRKLRVRTLVYDASGALASCDSVFLENWSSPAVLKPCVAPGEYTVFAISDVVTYQNNKASFEYWTLSSREQLSTVKLVDTDWIGYQMKIMGIASGKLNVTTKGGSLDLRPKAAGALFFILYRNIHHYSDVNQLGVAVQKKSDYLTFDASGSYTVSMVSDGTSYAKYNIHRFDPTDESSTNIYCYQFELPAKNYGLKFKVGVKNSSTGNTSYLYSNGFSLNLEPGQQWLLTMDLSEGPENNYAEECTLMDTSSDIKAVPAVTGSLLMPWHTAARKCVNLTEFE